eukprot:CAMPEP_0201558230 /NCGR_PEP_ID=MMETSP0173_2-20130828/66718_1 /ASSEMBLY_ACC=CAM_ASM_000268 /TAXON_ID=218659 /ORGANISM="Vexillifera sp., Strain DIVA3 564/2" /LENGTH=203 /DNA_ID=CAMNT_0047971541 /DNA_START=213 /DNA_END=821 /DNA_ORIENTATION=+
MAKKHAAFAHAQKDFEDYVGLVTLASERLIGSSAAATAQIDLKLYCERLHGASMQLYNHLSALTSGLFHYTRNVSHTIEQLIGFANAVVALSDDQTLRMSVAKYVKGMCTESARIINLLRETNEYCYRNQMSAHDSFLLNNQAPEPEKKTSPLQPFVSVSVEIDATTAQALQEHLSVVKHYIDGLVARVIKVMSNQAKFVKYA